MTPTVPHPPVVDARTVPVTAALFDHERDTIPKPWTGPLGDLLGSTHQQRETKAGTPCFSMAIYLDGAKRGNAGVTHQTAIVLDLDHVTDEDLAKAWAWLSTRAGVLYTSFSDRAATATDRCARMVVLLKRPVTPAEAKVVWAEVVQQLGVPTDEHTTDPARLWYVPACPPARISTSFIAYTAGPLLAPDLILAAAPSAPATQQAVTTSVVDWRELVINGATPGGRHAAIVKLAAHLIGKKVDPHVALSLVLAWNRTKNMPPKPDDEVIAAVNYVAGRELDRREGRHDR